MSYRASSGCQIQSNDMCHVVLPAIIRIFPNKLVEISGSIHKSVTACRNEIIQKNSTETNKHKFPHLIQRCLAAKTTFLMTTPTFAIYTEQDAIHIPNDTTGVLDEISLTHTLLNVYIYAIKGPILT